MGFKAGDEDCFEKARAAARQIVKKATAATASASSCWPPRRA